MRPGVSMPPSWSETATGLTPFGLGHNTTLASGIPKAGYSGFFAGGCCGTAAAAKVDDVKYVTDVVADVEKRVPIDRSRSYIMGFSTGALLAESAACEPGVIFAASGAVAGDLIVPCDQGANIVAVHGGKDTKVPLRGGYSPDVHFTFGP